MAAQPAFIATDLLLSQSSSSHDVRWQWSLLWAVVISQTLSSQKVWNGQKICLCRVLLSMLLHHLLFLHSFSFSKTTLAQPALSSSYAKPLSAFTVLWGSHVHPLQKQSENLTEFFGSNEVGGGRVETEIFLKGGKICWYYERGNWNSGHSPFTHTLNNQIFDPIFCPLCRDWH